MNNSEDIMNHLTTEELVFDLPIGKMGRRSSYPPCSECKCDLTVILGGSASEYAEEIVHENGHSCEETPCDESSSSCSYLPSTAKVRFDRRYAIFDWIGGGRCGSLQNLASLDIFGKIETYSVCDCNEKSSTCNLVFRRTFEMVVFAPNKYSYGEVECHCTPAAYTDGYPESANTKYCDFGTSVTLVATPYDCYEFDHWECDSDQRSPNPRGDAHGIDIHSAVITFTALPYNHLPFEAANTWGPVGSIYIAVFKQKKHKLIVNAIPKEAFDRVERDYWCGAKVDIPIKAKCGYKFVRWSDGETDNPRQIIMDGDHTLTAEFEKIPLSLKVFIDHGSYTVSKPGPYYIGDVVTVLAQPDTCYKIDGEASETVTFGCTDYNVYFWTSVKKQTLTLSMVGAGWIFLRGDVIPFEDGEIKTVQYSCGTTLGLWAVPKPCWKFSHWSGDVSDETDEIIITLDDNKEITAVCERVVGILECKGQILCDDETGDPLYCPEESD